MGRLTLNVLLSLAQFEREVVGERIRDKIRGMSPTSSPAVRYWNMARQRYHRLSARCSRALRVSADQAARPGPDTRGKPRLLDPERRIPARDRSAPDLYGAFSVKRLFWVCCQFFVR